MKKEEQKTESQHPLEVGIKGRWRTEIDLRGRQVLWGAMCALLESGHPPLGQIPLQAAGFRDTQSNTEIY